MGVMTALWRASPKSSPRLAVLLRKSRNGNVLLWKHFPPIVVSLAVTPVAVAGFNQRDTSPCRCQLQAIREFLHPILVFLDAFHEAELSAAAIQVVLRTMDAEIGVAVEEIRQEA